MWKKFQDKLSFKNPVIAAQVMESPFIADSRIGHTMPQGKDFIGENEYIGIDALIEQLKKSNKKIILNIGDSSTSGWDSNIVTENRKRKERNQSLLPAFFNYKTYSDYLRDVIGKNYEVINAGVPAHTSLQGSLRLEYLLDVFNKEGISISWVTAYYGNNDSVWDHNRQDKDWVGKKKTLFKRKKNKKENITGKIIMRVSEKDYKNNIRKIISLCKKNDIPIIVIKPLTPIYWKPGTRVMNEDLERKAYPGHEDVYRSLDEGLRLWDQAINEKNFSKLKETTLHEVSEKDYIVPRIKKGHLDSLISVVIEEQTPFINVELDRSEDDIQYFIDYCHPIHKANELISDEISAIVLGKKRGLFKTSDKKQEIQINLQAKLGVPTDHYVLY